VKAPASRVRRRSSRRAATARPAPNGGVGATFAALADPSRREVVRLLGRGPRCAGDLAQAIGLRAPAMSRHLRTLKASGLIEDARDERDARLRVFRLRPEPLSAVREWVAEVEAFWSEQLAAFKAYAERQPARAADRGARA